jgi:Tat protein translocase TatB subunit
VFGISFTELVVVVVVALVVLGPQKLPGLFRSIGQWIAHLRRITTEVRAQSGIDEILRAEGLQGGLSELRGILRHPPVVDTTIDQAPPSSLRARDPYGESFGYDATRERPVEGPDSYDAIAEDLVEKADRPGVEQ